MSVNAFVHVQKVEEKSTDSICDKHNNNKRKEEEEEEEEESKKNWDIWNKHVKQRKGAKPFFVLKCLSSHPETAVVIRGEIGEVRVSKQRNLT